MASKIDGLYKIRHSAAHVMAQAVLELYPEAKFAIGPPIDNGFYYDFDLGVDQDGSPRTFRPEDLKAIEKRMRQIIGGKHQFAYREVSAEEARQLFADQPYKLELIDGLADGEIDEYGNEAAEKPVISTYKHDTFEDLCRGPHVEHTGQIVADGFQLLSVAGAYWRGDEKNAMLQRIYGTAWRNRKELRKHLDQLEEAKKRDHRKLGRELEIFILKRRSGRVCLSGCRAAPSSSKSSNAWPKRPRRRPATIACARPISPRRTSSCAAGTSISTKTACTRRWRWKASPTT